MNKVDEVFEDIFSECHEDDVGLWVIVWRLKHAGFEESKIFETTMAIVSKLLATGKIIAGNYDTTIDNDFHQWETASDKIIERIRREWQELGCDPNLGDIVWFTAKKSSE